MGAINGTFGGFFGGGGAAAGLDPSLYLLRSGGAMLGPLLLYGDPTLPREAVTLQYLEAQLADTLDAVQIGLVMPAEFTVTGSPAGHAGTFTVELQDQAANMIFAGPVSGMAAAPGFRALVAADISDLSTTLGDYLLLTGGSLTGSLDITGDLSATGELEIDGDASVAGKIVVPTIDSGSTAPVHFIPDLEADQIALNPDIQTWGTVQGALAAIDNNITTLARGMAYVGSYDAASNIATFVSALSALNGPLPAANAAGLHAGDFLIATSASAGPPLINTGDQLISGGPSGGATWDILYVGNIAITASMVAITAATGIPAGWTTAQAAFADIANGAAQTPWLSNINADGYMLCSGSVTNDLVFGTGVPTAPAERMRIASNGNVGIGNNGASLAANFDVPELRQLIVGPTHSGAWYGVITAAGNSANYAIGTIGTLAFANFSSPNANKNVASISGLLESGSLDRGMLRFATYTAGGNFAERMRITSAGTVGIGNDASAPFANPTPFPQVIVGGAAAGSNYGFITACGNTSTITDSPVGVVAWVNYAITGAEKRIAEIHALTGGAINSGALRFDTWSAGTRGERMRITSAGHVGIGTDAAVLPQASSGLRTLIVGSSTSATNYGVLALVGNTASTDGAVGDLSFANYNITATEKRLAVITGRTSGAVDSGALAIHTMNAGGTVTERMRITPTGNVGIANSGVNPIAPAGYPHLVVGPSTSSAVYGFVTACGNTATLSNAPVGVFAFANFAVTGAEKRIAEVHARTDGALNSGFMAFYTWRLGANTERMRIDSMGNVGLSVVPSYQLQLSTDSAAKPGTNTWTIASDRRTKRNVRRFDGDIEVIRQLSPTVSEYNGKAGTPDGARVVSFDADELRKIVPEAVTRVRAKLDPHDEEEVDVDGINTHEIFFHMLRAIQQLDREVRRLKGEV